MQIRKCSESDIASTGAFYDRVVLWLGSHINYPKWIYGVYPTMETVKASMKAGTQFICLDDNGKCVLQGRPVSVTAGEQNGCGTDHFKVEAVNHEYERSQMDARTRGLFCQRWEDHRHDRPAHRPVAEDLLCWSTLHS